MIPESVLGPTEPVTMTATAPLHHQCPFVHEADNGTVTITWSTCGKTIELHSLRQYLEAFRELEISHEELTDRIRYDLEGVQGIYALNVETTWETAGMGIKCSTSPTPAAAPK